jgi:transcriptional regulator with XRE-family HTH domain
MQVDPIYKAVGEVIRARRRHLGLTQEKLAPRAGVSRASLANVETGRQAILVHQLYRFAEALGMSPFDLLPVPAQNCAVGESLSELPLPDDLNAQQKKQIAQMLK